MFSILAATGMATAQTGNVGIGTTTPGTKLDVDGAITNRETAVAVAANAATVPANVSQVQLTGAATAAVAITVPAAPNAGQRLIVYNNTTGGFSATLGGFTVPNGQAMEFTYSNGAWQATNGGAIGGDFDWMKSGNAFPNSPGDTAQNIYHIGGNVGMGTNAPVGRLHVYNPTNGTEAGNDFLFDDESPISQIPGLALRRSNAGANLGADDMIGSIVFNPKINGSFGYTGSGIRSLYRGDGTNMLNNLVFNINSNQEAMRITETGNVGIGTNAPTTIFEAKGAAPQANVMLSTVPTASQFLGLWGMGGTNGTTDYQSAGINAYATENWTSTASGSQLDFVTTPNGSASRTLRMQINHDGNVGIFQNGNAGVNPLTLLHLRLQSSGGGGVFSANTANMALRLENLNNGQSVIQHFLTRNTAGTTKEYIMGINPDYSVNGLSGVFLMSRNGSNDFVVDLTSGNVAIAGLPDTAVNTKLTIGGSVKIVDGTQGANKVLTSDANGLASWKAGPMGLFVKSAGTQVWLGAATITDWVATTNDFGSAWNGSVYTVPAGMQGWYTIHTAYQTNVAGGGSLRTPFEHIQIMVNGTAIIIGTASIQVDGGTVNGAAPGTGSAVASMSYYLNAGDQVSITASHLSYNIPANTSTSIAADPVRTYLSILKQ